MSYKIKGKKIIWTLKLTLSASLRNYYVQTNIWVGKIITTMMIDELLPMNLAVVLSLVNKIFQPQINDWFLQAGNRWNCGTKKRHQTNQIWPNFPIHPPALQHTRFVQKYNVGGCILFINETRTPSPSFKINFGTPSPIYFIHPWIPHFGNWSSYPFILLYFLRLFLL